MRKKLLSILALLCLTVSSAWAQWTGGTYTATANETINSTINVTADATLTINAGVTVTVNRSITVANDKTLTIVGPGTLTVYGTDGANGANGTNGSDGVAAITGNIIVKGATVNAIGGAAGNGGDSSTGNGGTGAVGARGLSNGTVTIYYGTINATGGKGGNGGNSTAGQGGNGGQGGYAKAEQNSENLYYYGGTVNFTSGAVGKGGTGTSGNGTTPGRRKAFAHNILTLKNTLVTLTGDGANITPATKPTVNNYYTVNIVPNVVTSGNCGTTGHESDVTWTLTSDDVMTISGTGAMANYSSFKPKAPWDGYKASITSVVIESGVTRIGEFAFNQCTSLASVTIPTGVTNIGNSAFSGCTALETIILPAGVMTLGNNVFQNCIKLSSVTLPDLMTSIGQNAFYGCIALETITLPAGLTTINNQTFFNCSSLASITLPASLTTIGTSVFSGCTALANFIVDANSNSFATEDGVLFNKDKTKLVRYPQGKSGSTYTIPTSVTTIDKYAFYSCSSLTEITLPDALTTIDNYAFSYCSKLEAITIPASVTSIEYFAFRDCSILAKVTLNSNPFINEHAFDGIADGAVVTMNLTANEGETGEYWLTFYNENHNFEADANTQIFKARLSDKDLTLTKLETDKIVNADNAVILKSTAGTITMTLTSIASDNDFTSNSLEGVWDAAGLTAANPSTTFVLNNGTQGVGFYKLKSGKTLGVGKAYLTYSGSGAPSFLGFDETTGMNNVRCKTEDVRGEYYNLNGQRVAQPTKGLYIVNGKKVVIK